MRRRSETMTLAEFPIRDTRLEEMCVVVYLACYPERMAEARGVVEPGMFSDGTCRTAYETLLKMDDANEVITLDSLGSRIGPGNVAAMLAKCPPVGGTDSFRPQALKDAYLRRSMYLALVKAFSDNANPEKAEQDVIADTIASLEGLMGEAEAARTMQTSSDAINDLSQIVQKVKDHGLTRVPTGIRILDWYTYGGFNAGNLVILAARPSVGKTSVMLQMAKAAAYAGKEACVFSLEMKNTEIVHKLMASTGLVKSADIATGEVRWSDFEDAASQVPPMHLNDSAYSLEAIVSQIRLARKYGACDVAYIDYLGLITMGGDKPLYQMLGDATRTLKQTAKQCDIPIVLLCQLNRASASERREPQLYDLRDSGSIEQDADIVLMLDRPRTGEEDADDGDVVNVYLRKNRQGKANVDFSLRATNSYTTFEENN